ncbi:MAG: type II 3-dehydroquinate dehydratase [Pseudomonadota bacterium]
MKLLILNGPNLNLLGTREPEIYGADSLSDIEARCVAHGKTLGVDVSCAQSNHEGALVEALHAARGSADGVVLNAGAYTHTSIALRDAIAAIGLPVVELHLSNTHKREGFRHPSMIAGVCAGIIQGFGASGYTLAITALKDLLDQRRP